MHARSTSQLRQRAGVSLIVLAGLLAACPATATEDPPAGLYGYQGGILSVGRHSLRIDTTGANGHSCSVIAQRIAGRWQSAPAYTGAPACLLSFARSGPSLWTVSGSPFEACRMNCGVRAGFEGEYRRISAGCAPSERRRRHDSALDAYRKQSYAEAATALARLVAQCEPFMDWREAQLLANDRAITAYHRGDKALCRALSARVADTTMLEQMRTGAPSDYENFKPRFEAARHNAALCAD